MFQPVVDLRRKFKYAWAQPSVRYNVHKEQTHAEHARRRRYPLRSLVLG
jgi:hypothetical protein